jgi:PDZ domain-containing protein
MRFSRLPRLAVALVSLFLFASLVAPLPFTILEPGGGKDVLGTVIDVHGAKTYPSKGKLLLITVLATSPSAPIFGVNVLYAWLKGDLIVLPRSALYPPHVSSTQINATNKADMQDSQQSATAAALAYLGYPATQRAVTVAISLKDTGGPSGGLIFALGIITKMTSGDLLAGRTIAGTGTIDGVGHVGAIGGIEDKFIAARRAGATVFLAPSENCKEVHHIPKGLVVYSVASLQEAVSVLRDATNAVPHCTWQRNR